MNQANIKEKILVIDDNPMNRDLITTILEEENLLFDEAPGGKEALQLIKTGDYWLAFIDLLMPGMDGFETTRQIRHQGFTFPIVAVSAISFKQDRRAAFDSGCDDFIPKPVDVELLIKIINKYRDQLLKKKADQGDKGKQSDSPPLLKRQDYQAGQEVDFTNTFILLVEEDKTLRHEFTSFLQNDGCQVQSFGNGADAWKHINTQETKPDIVISNIRMPEIDGLGLLAMIKREYPLILFFLYAPQLDADTIQLAAQEGVDNILPMGKFRESIFDIITSESIKSTPKDFQSVTKNALRQVRQAQEQLIRFGCEPRCHFCDIAYASLQQAGGDLASCRQFNLEGRCGVVLMDVAGHNIVSSYLSAVFWGILSSNWNTCQHPKDLANLLNKELCKLGYTNSHVCLTAILWDPLRRKLSVTYAGNPGAVIVSKNQNDEIVLVELEGGGMVIGILQENEQMIHQEFELSDECSFIFYSDGIKRQQLKQVISSKEIPISNPLSDISSQHLLEQILSHYGQDDDMIVVKLNIPPKPTEYIDHLPFKSDYEGVDYACLWLETKLSNGSVPQELDIFNIMLCVREALLNSVEHGNQSDSKKLVDVSINHSATCLEIRTSDEGPGFNLADKLKEVESTNGFQVGKRGLLLMNSIADSIDVIGGSVVLTFNKKKNQD
jgi:CheY-like chemotaxis protein/anti-sigma regulatory factor (Ser/Thr protein kinase)